MNKNTKFVEILLPCFENGHYLRELLSSIQQQTYPHFRLLMRDDTTSAMGAEKISAIFHEFSYHDSRFINLTEKSKHLGRLGVNENFNYLLSQSSSDTYLMFCDGDDVWPKDKVEKTLNSFLLHEGKEKRPLLTYTDLVVVDEKMNLIAKSFFSHMKINPLQNSLEDLLITNVVTGNTVMINQPLKNLVHPFPSQVIMYDWYMALMAKKHASLVFLPLKTTLYRQHQDNKVGAKKRTHKKISSIKSKIKEIKTMNLLINKEEKNFFSKKVLIKKIFSFRDKKQKAKKMALLGGMIFQ